MTVTWNGDAIAEDMAKRALDGLEELGHAVIETDARENCPVALVNGGTLRDSHVTERNDEEKTVTVGVGGPGVPYARRQHEDATYHHTVGEHHWLENAFNRHVAEAPEFIKKHL